MLTGYLRRLGLGEMGPPSAEALAALHRAHVERIAYTTVDIQRGCPPPIDPATSAERIARTGRGGYCFHLNGALAVLLARLGYDVRWHRGGVWNQPDEAPLRPFANHLALTVHALPTPDNPGGGWLVDAGLGDALYEPLALRPGPVTQAGFTYELRPSPRLAGGWQFRHDPRGSFRQMDFEPGGAVIDDFAASHAHLSTSPESGFVQRLSAQRRDAHGFDKLISCTLRRVDATGTTDRELTTLAELRGALADVFGLALDDVSPGDWDTIWRRARAAHDEYLRSLDVSA